MSNQMALLEKDEDEEVKEVHFDEKGSRSFE